MRYIHPSPVLPQLYDLNLLARQSTVPAGAEVMAQVKPKRSIIDIKKFGGEQKEDIGLFHFLPIQGYGGEIPRGCARNIF